MKWPISRNYPNSRSMPPPTTIVNYRRGYNDEILTGKCDETMCRVVFDRKGRKGEREGRKCGYFAICGSRVTWWRDLCSARKRRDVGNNGITVNNQMKGFA